MRQVNRSSKRSASSTKELSRKARLDCSSRPHLIRSDRQASSLLPTCCRRNSLTDKVTPTYVVAPKGEGRMKNPEPALCRKLPRLRSTVRYLGVPTEQLLIENRLCACGYDRSKALDARFRGHRERECRIAQRHVVTSADGFCYLHSRSAVPPGRGKASRHDLPLGPCPNSSRKFLQQTEGGSLATPNTV